MLDDLRPLFAFVPASAGLSDERRAIRPFMAAEVIRHNKKPKPKPKLNMTWDKDRGKDVASAPWFHKFSGERINDHHLTRAEKMAAKHKEDKS